MATLHIEHAISDLPTWLRAFSHFEAARRRAGVRAERVLQPIDDDKYIYVDLEFDNVDQAAAFQEFLETNTARDSNPRAGHPSFAGSAIVIFTALWNTP